MSIIGGSEARGGGHNHNAECQVLKVGESNLRVRSLRHGRLRACLLIVAASIAGCDTINTGDNTDKRPDVFDHVRSIDLEPRTPSSAGVDRASTSRPPRAESYFGRAPDAVASVPVTPSGDGYELNFDNTPVATVAKVILGDILGTGYTIDPRIQGTISLASGQPVQRTDLL